MKPCPDVHRMVNGRCENCGVVDPFADKPFDSVSDLESSMRAFAYSEVDKVHGEETGVVVLVNTAYRRLLATARAHMEDRLTPEEAAYLSRADFPLPADEAEFRIAKSAARKLDAARHERGSERPEVRTCRWTLDDDGVYGTACGNRWYFDSGTASENMAAFCMYCGKALHDTVDAAIARLKRSGQGVS